MENMASEARINYVDCVFNFMTKSSHKKLRFKFFGFLEIFQKHFGKKLRNLNLNETFKSLF